MADLFRQSIGMKNLKYTKYSCVFHTSTCQKISRRPLLLIESELPDTLLFRGAPWDKCKMESGKFPAARCRGGACRSRHCTAESYRLTIKTYKPIASVAALSERLAHLQVLRYKFIGARPPSLSFRGAKRRGNLAVPAGAWESYRRNRNCLPEIATSAYGLLAMTIRGCIPY